MARMQRSIASAGLVLVAAGCGARHRDPPDADASDDAGRDAGEDAGRDAGEDAAVDAGRPCPNPPAVVGAHEFERGIGGVAAQGSFVLVASWEPALLVLDASDPENLVEVTELYPEQAGGIVGWSDDRAVIGFRTADRSSSYVVLDMTSPVFPAESGVLPGNPISVQLATPFAFATTELEFLVYDVEQPKPTVIARTPVSVPGAHWIDGLAVGGDTAFLVNEPFGDEFTDAHAIHAIDISEPSLPEYVGVLVPAGWEVGSHVTPLPDDLMYYRDGEELRLLDVADPSHPRLVGVVDVVGFSLPGFTDNLLFFSNPDPDSPEGSILGIAPLEDPLAPRIEWTVRLPVAFGSPAVSDGLAYVPEAAPGLTDTLFVVDLGCAVQ